MTRRLPDDNLPPGLTSADAHFNPEQIECPVCDRITVVGFECEHCGAELNGDTVRDLLEDQMLPPEWA